MTRSAGVAELHPCWSPDGGRIAYFSDRSGEYELTVRPVDDHGEEQVITSLGPGYRYKPSWSPNGEWIAFADQAMHVHLVDVNTGNNGVIDSAQRYTHKNLRNFSVNWSPGGRWLAYARDVENTNDAIFLYDTQERKLHQVTSGYYDDSMPVFGTDGNYLFYTSKRHFQPTYDGLDGRTWVCINTTKLVAIPLRKDVPSPLAPRVGNDEQEISEQTSDDHVSGKQNSGPAHMAFDIDGFEGRAVVLPPEEGNYGGLAASGGKLIFHRLPRTGTRHEKPSLYLFDFSERKEKLILENVDEFDIFGGDRLLIRRGKEWFVVDAKPSQKVETPLATSELRMFVEPKAEWRQIFNDAWRLQRDFFYDKGMHGIDWLAVKKRYEPLLARAKTRSDVNFIIGEMLGELNSSHAYRGGGDVEDAIEENVGSLGVDFALENGAFRIKRILDPGVFSGFSDFLKSPLRQPGLGVSEGDYLLAINGVPLDARQEPWAALVGLASKTVRLTVASTPSGDNQRMVHVKTLPMETYLRHVAWIEQNRIKVDRVSEGRVGYIYVWDTSVVGQGETIRQFQAQFHKDALIIDERFNAGGHWPDRLIEVFQQPRTAYVARRYGPDEPVAEKSHIGPKAMLINGWAGSGGDAFPYMFRQARLGPLIGTRTWGGLIGTSGTPKLMDGGTVSVPTLGFYDVNGKWLIEGHGVSPDIEVVDNPAEMVEGNDPQLDKAIEVLLEMLEENPVHGPSRPKSDIRTARAFTPHP